MVCSRLTTSSIPPFLHMVMESTSTDYTAVIDLDGVQQLAGSVNTLDTLESRRLDHSSKQF